ncbi:MAG: hypothetical protein J7517_08630 [Sphingobium yanoikuyae]|nr:hypothetical protein [Sphingobium yanoikuyae]
MLLGIGLYCGTLALAGIVGSMGGQTIALLAIITLIALPLAVIHAPRTRRPLLDLSFKVFLSRDETSFHRINLPI